MYTALLIFFVALGIWAAGIYLFYRVLPRDQQRKSLLHFGYMALFAAELLVLSLSTYWGVVGFSEDSVSGKLSWIWLCLTYASAFCALFTFLWYFFFGGGLVWLLPIVYAVGGTKRVAHFIAGNLDFSKGLAVENKRNLAVFAVLVVALFGGVFEGMERFIPKDSDDLAYKTSSPAATLDPNAAKTQISNNVTSTAFRPNFGQ